MVQEQDKIYISTIGRIGAGKGLFTELSEEVLGERVAKIRFSDPLKDILVRLDIPLERINYSLLSMSLREKFGGGFLAHANFADARKKSERIILIDGMRWIGDLNEFRTFPNNYVVFIDAPLEVRHQRTLERNEKLGENRLTIDQFIKLDNGPAEGEIAEICESADYKIDNLTDSIDDYKAEIEKFWEWVHSK